MMNAGKNIVYNHFDPNRIYAAVRTESDLKTHPYNLPMSIGTNKEHRITTFFDRDIIRLTFYRKLKI